MGAASSLLKAGIAVLGAGFLVAVLVPPLGVLLVRIVFLLVGLAALLVTGIGLLTVLLVANGATAPTSRTTRTKPHRRTSASRSRRRQTSRTSPKTRPPADQDHEQVDLDVDTIEDYRR